MSNVLTSLPHRTKNILVFAALWSVSIFIYLPIAQAGWVIDAIGWIYDMKHHNFWDFINRNQSKSQSFYQLFAIHYYIFYKLWGMNVWLWSLLYTTVHAINAYLLFIVLRNIFSDANIKRSGLICLCGVSIFLVCPHISEPIVWKACFHYLLSFLFILLTMHWVQRYQHAQKTSYALLSAVVFILASFTLEIFYLIPFFVLSLAIYYRIALGYDKAVFRKTIKFFFLPQVVMMGLYFAGLFAVYRFIKPHKTELTETTLQYFAKLPKYLFNIVFLGRYFPVHAKEQVYSFLASVPGLALFYGVLTIASVAAAIRFKKLSNVGKTALLLSAWILVMLCFLFPLSFPNPLLLVFYDRYTYFADGFIYVLLALLIAQIVKNKYLAILLYCVYIDFNLFFTIQVNTDWLRSEAINRKLLSTLPAAGNKTILLLSVPENMNGAPMIGAQPESEFKSMYETLTDKPLPNTIYDVASYNMTYDQDGSHVMVINDTLLHVTLNQWSTWWWYEGHGAKSYETKDYRVNMVDPGHWYELILKRPASEYLLLYSTGDKWRTVDMSRKNEDLY